MEWRPITITGRQVRGRDPEYPGLLNIDLTLSATPPEQWAGQFLNPSDFGIPISVHKPRISGSVISIRPPDEEVEKYAEHIDQRVAYTNEWFEQQVLPHINAAEEREKAEQEAEAERLREAQRKLDEMQRQSVRSRRCWQLPKPCAEVRFLPGAPRVPATQAMSHPVPNPTCRSTCLPT